MLFSLLLTANAASFVISTYPCQRLGWAWRNVWVACSIDARVPDEYVMPQIASVVANAPNFNEGLRAHGKAPYNAAAGEIDLDVVGTMMVDTPFANFPPALNVGPSIYRVDAKGISGSAAAKFPLFCSKVGAPAAPTSAPAGTYNTGVRTACRRAIDLYGSLLELCRNPQRARIPLQAPDQVGVPTASYLQLGTKNRWQAAEPTAFYVPHAANAISLSWLAQQCIAPGALPTAPLNSCPGLMGWWTVTYQACNIANIHGGNAPALVNTPTIQGLVVGALTGGNALTNPEKFCTTSTTIGASNWNVKDANFKKTPCRRALDQFTRTANRCSSAGTTNFLNSHKLLTELGVSLGLVSPNCNP